MFDANFYRAANRDLAGLNNTQALLHFQLYGLNEGRAFSPFIDLSFYRASNSDLAKYNNSQLLNHLETYGVAEGRKFSPFVDLNFYHTHYNDLLGLNNEQLFNHLENYGIAEGRQFSPLIDLKYYSKVNADLANYNNQQALVHLELYGLPEGREFSQFFSVNYYKSSNPDLVAAKLTNIQLLEHFELYGLPEGRKSYPGKNTYQAQNGELVSGILPTPSADLSYFGGKTIANLNFFNLYFGGSQSWNTSDIQNIDSSLSEAMSDVRLNSIISQYFPGQSVTSNFLGSRIVEGSLPNTVNKNYIESLFTDYAKNGAFNGYDLASTVFDILLPKSTILTDGTTQSTDGLGGYHGSVHFQGQDGTQKTVYYAIGVYSQTYSYLGVTYSNGIPAFNEPWKSVVATAYHELNEARTDPDVEDAIRNNNNTKFLGWYSIQGGEVGDYPITEAYSYNSVFREVRLINGHGTVPIQVLYSNVIHGPEDPTTILLS
jgi:hypothetical protein